MEELQKHLKEKGKTASWISLANQFNYLIGESDKKRSDGVRRLFNKLSINVDNTKIHITLGCVHVPFHNEKLINSLLAFISEYKDKIGGFHLIGDFLDLKSLSSHDDGVVDKSGLTLGKEYSEGNRILDMFDAVLPQDIQKSFLYGNHCFSEDTELLTEDGWVNIDDASEDMKFASINPETKELIYDLPIGNIIRQDYTGKMHQYLSYKDSSLVTPGHKLFLSNQTGKDSFCKSEDLKLKDFYFYHSIENKQQDNSDYSDFEIQLAAWIHSDGRITHKSKSGNITYCLYQSKEENCKKIETILGSLCLEYRKSERQRDIVRIMNKDIVSETKVSCEYYIKAGQFNLVKDKYILGDWLKTLSKRQFDIFLNSYIDGDGSRKNNTSGCAMIYGQKEILDQLQNLCFTNGHITSIYEYCTNSNKIQYKLNVDLDKTRCKITKDKNFSEVDYSGRVWCVTLPQGTVVSKRNTKITIQGNCDRFLRTISSPKANKYADALIAPEDALNLKARGYKVFTNWKEDYITIGKYQAFHGIYCTQTPAKTHVSKLKHSCIFAHTHRIDQYFEGELHGVNIGCFADIESSGFRYLSRIERKFWKNGFGITHINGKQSHTEVIVCENDHFFYAGKQY